MTMISAPVPAGEAPARVLVVDDDASVRAMLRAWLHLQGCESELQSDAAGGAQALRERTFDLLICDVQLPDGDGPELAASITGPNAGLPVIFLTGAPSLETAMRSVKLRAVAYLTKPPSLDELAELLRREVTAHRYRQSVASHRRLLASWDSELARLEEIGDRENRRLSVDYLQVTLRHLGRVLGDLDRSVSLLATDGTGRDTLEKIDLVNGLRRTVEVLERTRDHFKSKDLGDLRKELEQLLSRFDRH
jgi:DNA-binding NtrC family response regulator